MEHTAGWESYEYVHLCVFISKFLSQEATVDFANTSKRTGSSSVSTFTLSIGLRKEQTFAVFLFIFDHECLL